MKTARQSDKVTWWAMGRTAVTRYGKDKALKMADDITNAGCKVLFLSGVNGEPRPRVRPAA